MIIFMIIASISLLGIGAVFWLFNNEKKFTEEFVEKVAPEELLTKPSITPTEPAGISERLKSPEFPNPSIKEDLSEKLKSRKNKQNAPGSPPPKSFLKIVDKIREKIPIGKKRLLADNISESRPFTSLQDSLNMEENLKNKNATEYSLNESVEKKEVNDPVLETKQEERIEKGLEFSLQFTELKEKYERLDNLFKEKSAELEKAQKTLDNELKNKKDFDKVKNIIEKEIREVKDKARETQNELNKIKEEKENSERNVIHLEDKIKELTDNLEKLKNDSAGPIEKTIENEETLKIKTLEEPLEPSSGETKKERPSEKEPKILSEPTSRPTPSLVEKKNSIFIIDDSGNHPQEFQPEEKDKAED